MEIILKAKRMLSEFDNINANSKHFYITIRFRLDQINQIVNSELLTYFKKYQILPKKQYIEYEGCLRFVTYLFGYCYIKDHLSQISRLSSTL